MRNNPNKKPPIMLESLTIHRSYDKKLYGAITFKGKNAKTELRIDEDMCRKVIELCAESLVEAAREIAEELRADCLMIEAKPETEK